VRAWTTVLTGVALGAIGLVGPAGAGELPLTSPQSVGMSAAQLDRIGAVLADSVARGDAPGYVTLVARRGRVVHHAAHGRMDPEGDAPMGVDALFSLASMTKPVAAVAALILYEEGRLGMHEPLSEYLPALADLKVQVRPGITVAAEREMTFHDLLTHTSGFDDGEGRIEMYAHPTLAEHMEGVLGRPLRAQPGTRWRYGDSFDVLGYLVQVVSGQPLDVFLAKRIFAPLGMTDTFFWPPAEKQGRVPVLQQDGVPDRQRASRQPPEAARRHTYVSGSSGLYSTAADYWRFSQMLLNGGTLDGVRIMGRTSVEWMNVNHIGDLEMAEWVPPGFRFGLGVRVLVDPAEHWAPASPGSFGWGGALGTDFWVDPEEDLVGIIMMQVRPNAQRARRRFESIVYSSLLD